MGDMADWIRAVEQALTQRGQYGRIALWHGSADAAPVQLDSFDQLRDVEKNSVVDADRLATHFQALAQRDADSYATTGGPTSQRYMLSAHYADDENGSTFFPFAVIGAAATRPTADAFSGSEPHTEKGSIAMQMRLNDNLFRMLSQFIESGPGVLMGMNRELARQLEAEKQANIDRWLLQQAQLDKQQDRLILAAREEHTQKHRDEVWQLAKGFAPMLVKGLPNANGTAVLGESLMQFAAGLTDGEMTQLVSAVSPARRPALMVLLDALGAEATKREAEAAKREAEASKARVDEPGSKGRAA